MAKVQVAKNFGGATSGGSGSSALQTAEGYLFGTSNVGSSSASSTIEGDSAAQLYSPNAGVMASSWDLPPNLGSLTLKTGNSETTQIPSKTRTAVASGVEMLNIYDKLDSGEALTQADVNAASKLGPDIERAAQLAASGKPAKGARSAITKAQNEIAVRLHSTVGLPPTALGKEGLNAKVPASFAATMQNAGYAVTKNMTVKQALGAAQSVVGGGQPPTSMQGDMTVAQYTQSLASMSKSQITQLQQQLYNNGFYDSEYYGGTDTDKGADTKEYTQGVLDTGTILAFRKAILQTLVDQKQGKNVTLDQTINGGASTNPALGNVPVTGGTSTQSASTVTAPMATDAQTQQPLINAFVAAIGRNPSQQELSAFTSTYENELLQGNKTLAEQGLSPEGAVDYSSGVPFVQGVPTVAAAATNYAEDTDPVAYQGHNIADAFGLLMNLVDRQGTSSLDTLGTRPTTTT
jgi:hypothetical protein